MTAHHPPSPDHVRIVVDVENGDRHMVGDFPLEHLAHWLASMGGLTPVPLPRGTEEGACTAREIFRLATMSDYPLMACLAALWICLFGPGNAPDRGLSLDDLTDAAGTNTLTIQVSGGGTRWEYALESKIGDDVDFKTVGNA